MSELWDLIQHSGRGIELTEKIPNPQEKELLANMMNRCDELVQYARERRVKLLIDAEHHCFQPAIDNFVLALQRKHNQDFPYIYQTFQCYKKEALELLALDKERALRENWKFAAKLVRGAYMEYERDEAIKVHQVFPVYLLVLFGLAQFYCWLI
eukprot:m.64773 g.64773  ORF g.64773 m.64773 type:complete len:154 (+) comp11504_c0_seq2:1136-1597(+)